jgi:iron complex transport system permease protein
MSDRFDAIRVMGYASEATDHRSQPSPTSNARSAQTLRTWGIVLGALLVLLCAMVVSTGAGAIAITPGATLRAFAAGLLGHGSQLSGLEAIAWNLRVPRVLMAALVGASLGASGAALQGLFRNPLADPYILGAASGASLGATVVMSLSGQLGSAFGVAAIQSAANGSSLIPPAAFLGAGCAVLLTLALSKSGGRARAAATLLAGTVVGTILLAATTYLMLRDADRVRAVLLWMLGSLSLSSYHDVATAFPYAAAGIAILCIFARGLDALALGEETARTLGVNARLVRLATVAGASLATASAVAFVGVVGFVGLVAPHIMRRLGTTTHRALLPAAALGGAVLVVLADLGARTLVRPAELPIGIVTALLGGPFFLWLLWRQA